MTNQELYDEIKRARQEHMRQLARERADTASAKPAQKHQPKPRPEAVPGASPERIRTFAELCRARCALLARRQPAQVAVE